MKKLLAFAGTFILCGFLLWKGFAFFGSESELPLEETQGNEEQTQVFDIHSYEYRSVAKDWKEIVHMMDKQLKAAIKAGDAEAAEVYGPLVHRLKEINDRLFAPNCDLSHEETEIRKVREAVEAHQKKASSNNP